MTRYMYYKKNHHLKKCLSCHRTLGKYVHHIYRIAPNIHISPSVLCRGSCKFACSIIIIFFIAALIIRWFGQIIIAAIDLAAASPEVFLYWQLHLMISSFPFLSNSPTFSALFWCNKFISVSFNEIFALSW